MGDVGTGKTVVALFAMLLARRRTAIQAALHGADRAARRAARTRPWPGCSRRSGCGPSCCSAGCPRPKRRPSASGSPRGSARLVVGTHALMQESVRVPAARPGRDRRAAPVRRRAAGGADRQGRRARRAAADRDADPALARADALRRPRRLDAATSGRPGAGTMRDRACGRAISGSRCSTFVRDAVPARAARPTSCCPVIEESEKADLRAATTMAETLRGALARRCSVGPGARPAQAGRAGRRDAALPRRRDPRAGGHDGDRGRHRRAQCDDHGGRAPGALRPRAAAPAPRAGSGRGSEESYCILLADGGVPTGCSAFAATHRRVQDRGAGSGRSAEWAT